MLFEWDEDKARANEAKHGVPFHEAKTVFNDPFAMTIADPDHSRSEFRWLDIGFSVRERILVVWYTERGGRVRIIGCRRATRAERRAYQSESNDSVFEMREEYDFSNAERGKHYRAYREGHAVRVTKSDGTVEACYFTLEEGAVMLDPDLKSRFPDSESVNRALRRLSANGSQA